MDDKSKSKKEMPEKQSKENKEEKVKENQPQSEANALEKPQEKIKEKSEPSKKDSKKISTESVQTEKTKSKQEIKKEEPEKIKTRKETEKDKAKKKEEKDDFRYIVRIANSDIDGEKTLARGLTSIKGIGMHMSTLIIDITGLDRNLKMGNLVDSQIDKIKQALENVNNTAPMWMLNHRKDIETGKDIHLIGSEIDMRLRDEINIMKKIRSYKGIRHERGLTVRGQRTRGNNRKGLSLGVSKKRVQAGK